ncbi:hypothetical protein JYU34_019606 [Plutella xylostella]|uniref:Uncharacterized protein n=1 Tax=Plutella xylostella TaxID=51655 RepID=A0ABQ7PX51_PLUXY|nr:hypothetical protein JYU34_019606 [Plutella xylostella]
MHSATLIFGCFVAVLSYLALDATCDRRIYYDVTKLDSRGTSELFSRALGSRRQLYAYLGLRNGNMLKCEMNSYSCARFNTVNQPITAITVDNNILYAGLANGLMLICPTQVKDACSYLNNGGKSINGIAVQGRYVYAGLDNGVLWRCEKYEANRCEDYTTFPNESIQSLAVTDQYMFVGLKSGNMLRCYVESPACLVLNSAGRPILSLAVSGGYIFAGLNNGIMWRCRADVRHACETFNRSNSPLNAITVGGRRVYAGLENKIVWQCSEDAANSCADLERTGYVIDSMDAFYI